MMPKLLKPKDAAEALAITPRMLRDLVRAGEIATVQIGLGAVRPRVAFSQDELDAFIKRRTTRQTPVAGAVTRNTSYAGEGFTALRERLRKEGKVK